MTRDPYRHAAAALRLAREGVTVTQLATVCGIHRTTAHRVLERLRDEGMLQRVGDIGRLGHTYHMRSSEAVTCHDLSPVAE